MSGILVLVREYDDHYEYSGTGFFVSDDGLFFTAAHVFEKDPSCMYWVAPNPSDLDHLVPLKLRTIDVQSDVALCSAEFRPTRWFTLAQDVPDPGASVRSVGYAGRSSDAVAVIETVEGRYLGHTASYAMAATPPFLEKRHPAVFSIPGLREGFSGGPLIDMQGDVIGLFSSTSRDAAIRSALGVEGDASLGVSVRGDILHGMLEALQSAAGDGGVPQRPERSPPATDVG